MLFRAAAGVGLDEPSKLLRPFIDGGPDGGLLPLASLPFPESLLAAGAPTTGTAGEADELAPMGSGGWSNLHPAPKRQLPVRTK